MHQEFFSYNQQDEDIVKRYEDMLRVDRVSYFDVEEFEVITEHYLEGLNFSKAFFVVEEAVLQHPYASSLKLLQAKVWLKKGNFRKALKILDKIGSLISADCEYWLLKGELYLKLYQYDDADAAFMRALEVDDEERGQTCIEIAYQWIGMEQKRYALKYLKFGYGFNPKNSDILYELGNAYLDMEEYEKSLLYFNKQLDIDPYLEETWFSIGLIYWDKYADAAKATEAFEYVLVINEKHEMALFFIAQIFFKQGNFLKAIESYEVFGINSDQQHHAALLIAECYEELNEIDKAIECYHKALEEEVNRFDAWLGLGYCYIELRNYKEGIRYFKKILDENNKFEEAWSGLGDCFFSLGHEELAIQSYERSLKINPDQSELWSAYADIFISLEKYDKAKEVLLEGLGYDADNDELKFQLSVTYFHTCEYEDARIILRELKEKGFEDLESFYDHCPEAKFNNSFSLIVKKQLPTK